MNAETQYLEILRDLVNSGVKQENRTGVDTYKIPPRMIQHDMSEGFPLLTTKRVAWKTMKVELEGFIKGITSKKWFQDRGCHIWDQWANPQKVPYSIDPKVQELMAAEDDLGKIYGYQWRNFNSTKNRIIKIKPKITEYTTNGVNEDVECGVCGVAYLGNPKRDLDQETEKLLYKGWYDMIRRCYSDCSSNFKYYGKLGVKVCDRWLCYEYYRKDVVNLNGWWDKLREPTKYSLDKDYYGSSVYAPDVCIWLSSEDNRLYNSSSLYRVYNEDGEDHFFLNKTHVANFLGFTRKNVQTYLGKDKDYNGYYIEERIYDGNLYRYQLPCDQLKDIIIKLKNNPTDRRMIVNAWNVSDLEEMALVPCHYGFQVMLRGDYLDLMWIQRSVDTMLGLPFNIASYALLLHLLAKEAGLKEGVLSGSLADLHLYENHIDQAKEQLSRTPYELPYIETENFKSIFDWEHDDTLLFDYKCHPAIKAPVAV